MEINLMDAIFIDIICLREVNLINTKNVDGRQGSTKEGAKPKFGGRFWCNDKFIVVNGSCGLICKVIANYFIYTCGYVVVSLRLCLVVSFCPMFRIVVSPCVNFLFAICVACDV